MGVDIGGTKTACVVTDADDRIVYREVVPTEVPRLAALVVELAGRAISTIEDDAADFGHVGAIGVAVPGQVEPRGRSLELAVNLGGGDAELGAKVESATGLPCFIEHDARAAASWVYERGAGATRHLSIETDGDRDLCYLSLGTGIAAGIFLDGRPLRGHRGLAGEVGHASADPGGVRCACGLTGCLETVAAGPAISRMARDAVAGGQRTCLGADASPADVFAAAREGDELAQEIVRRVGRHLARAIRGIVLTLGVRRVVIGGGVAASGDILLAAVVAAINEERGASQLVDTVFAETTVDILEPGLDPGARGAAAIARRELLGTTNEYTRIATAQREGVGER